MNNDFRYMKFIYLHCGEETNVRDPRSRLQLRTQLKQVVENRT